MPNETQLEMLLLAFRGAHRRLLKSGFNPFIVFTLLRKVYYIAKQITLCNITYRNVCTRRTVSTPTSLFSRFKECYEHVVDLHVYKRCDPFITL